MATMNRIGTSVLLLGGLALASLMVYTLLLADNFGPARPQASDVADVAIVFPEQNSNAWEEFRRGVLYCRDRGLFSDVLDTRTAMTVRTREGHRLRFHWTPASGLVQTRRVVRELMERPRPPVAIVGSENTALTAVLARALSEATGSGASPNDPVLLIPWATAVVAEPELPGQPSVPLLEIHPRRTFRFCPDNQRQADLLVRFALDRDRDHPPQGVMVLTDADDPFSRDLTQAFDEAIRESLPGMPVDERVAPPLPISLPDAHASVWAAEVWSAARAQGNQGPYWVVLTLQGEPGRRLLNSLAAVAPHDAASIPLRVLSGDGLGTSSLDSLSGSLPFPVWAASGGFVPDGVNAPPQGAQVMAEIALALARARDQLPPGGDLAMALRHLEIPADALGRSIAFAPDGERRGEDLGQILAIEPGSETVLARVRRSDGGWSNGLAVASERP